MKNVSGMVILLNVVTVVLADGGDRGTDVNGDKCSFCDGCRDIRGGGIK